jgi:translation initiation factor IF-1
MSEEWVWRILVFAAAYFAIRILCPRDTVIDSIFVALLFTVGLTLANAWYSSERISFKQKEYVIVAKKPPMFFSVTLKDIETGKIYKEQTVSKFCTNHENILVGDVVKLNESIYRFKNGRIVTKVSVHDISAKCLKDY